MDYSHLAEQPLATDSVGLLEGLTTTRAIRRYTDEPIPPDVLLALHLWPKVIHFIAIPSSSELYWCYYIKIHISIIVLYRC